MKFKIEIGDPSRDGHGLMRTDIVEIDLTMEDMKNAHIELYKRGINFSNDICNGYEDSRLKVKHQRLMIDKLGATQEEIIRFAGSDCSESEEEDGLYAIYIYEEDFTDLFLFCINKINPKLNARTIGDNGLPSYDCGWVKIDDRNVWMGSMGYGCFSM